MRRVLSSCCAYATTAMMDPAGSVLRQSKITRVIKREREREMCLHKQVRERAALICILTCLDMWHSIGARYSFINFNSVFLGVNLGAVSPGRIFRTCDSADDGWRIGLLSLSGSRFWTCDTVADPVFDGWEPAMGPATAVVSNPLWLRFGWMLDAQSWDPQDLMRAAAGANGCTDNASLVIIIEFPHPDSASRFRIRVRIVLRIHYPKLVGFVQQFNVRLSSISIQLSIIIILYIIVSTTWCGFI